jgi:glycerol uptake facilitator-like aquaporin
LPPLAQRSVAEGLGTAFLLIVVVGSGIMAASWPAALLCNTLPTGAIIAVLILIFGPLSGAHFNPAVGLAFALRGELLRPTMCIYIVTQVVGRVVGVWELIVAQCIASQRRPPSRRLP